MKSYDKAAWHIDGGEKVSDVINRFKVVFKFLSDKNLLSPDGVETMEFGMDSSVSLNSTMVNTNGKKFLDTYYDEILDPNPKKIEKNLQDAFEKFTKR